MVKRLFFFLFGTSLFAAPPLPETTTANFFMECAPTEIFEGEQSFCSFRLVSSHELVEVEVQKFPEFRGFWKENLSLRQGPLSAQLRSFNSLYTFAIGTYLVMPMVGNPNRAMDPMKIILRETPRLGGAPPEQTERVSVTPDLVIKSLPPIPGTEEKENFVGGVGQFTLSALSNPVAFTPSEPFTVRFQIQGRGNAPEINNLPWVVPPSIEVLSKRTEFQGSFQSFVKTFEYTLRKPDATALNLPAVRFVYFDPQLRQYQRLETQEIQLVPAAGAAAPIAAESPLPLSDLPKEFAVSQAFWNRPFFWIVQALLSAIAIAWGLWILKTERAARAALHRDPEWLVLRRSAERALTEKDARSFLKAAAAFIQSALADELGLPSYTPRTRVLENARPKLSEDLWISIRDLFHAEEKTQFGGSPTDVAFEPFQTTFQKFAETKRR